MDVQVIAKEFQSSTTKAIKSLSKSERIPENKAQIAFQLDNNSNSVYRLYNSFAFVRPLTEKEIMHVSFLYLPFKSKFSKGVNAVLRGIAERCQVRHTEISVLAAKSNAGVNTIRLMLYVQGTYKQDITEKDFANINQTA